MGRFLAGVVGGVAVFALSTGVAWAQCCGGGEARLSPEKEKALNEVAGEWVLVTLDGMYCESCAPAVEKALGSVKGVKGVTVSFERKEAVVRRDEQVCLGSHLVRAVMNANKKFSAELSPLTVKTFKIEGMKCDKCVAPVKEALGKTEGVKQAAVKKGQAVVVLNPATTDAGKVVEAIGMVEGPNGARYVAAELPEKKSPAEKASGKKDDGNG
jgi:copper ion binding protein